MLTTQSHNRLKSTNKEPKHSKAAATLVACIYSHHLPTALLKGGSGGLRKDKEEKIRETGGRGRNGERWMGKGRMGKRDRWEEEKGWKEKDRGRGEKPRKTVENCVFTKFSTLGSHVPTSHPRRYGPNTRD